DHPIPRGLPDLMSSAAIVRAQILPGLGERDLLAPDLIRPHFEQAICQAGPTTDHWDKPHPVSGALPCFPPHSTGVRTYRFRTAAETFRLIDSNTHAVLIPWGPEGKALAEEIRDLKKQNRVPNRSHYRRAQQFSVQVYDGEWQRLMPSLSF